MDNAINLIFNTALLISISIVFNLYYLRVTKQKMLYKILFGTILGLVGIVLMSNAIELPNGVIFDTRSILVSIAGLYYGIVPTSIAVVIIALYRFLLGGPGVVTGILATVSTASVGIVWRLIRKEKIRSWIEYYSFGVVTHIIMLLCMLTLPAAIVLETLRSISVPVLSIYPAGTLLLCIIISYGQKNVQTEKRLRESEVWFSTVFNQAPIGISVTNASGILYINPAFEKIIGRTREEISNYSWESFTYPEDVNKDAALYAELVLGQITEYDLDKRYYKPNGELVWVHMHVAALSVKHQEDRNYHLCMVQDISERVAQQRSLLESERKHRDLSSLLVSLLNSIPDLIFYKDQNCNYLGCNKAFEELCDRDESELIGIDDFELFDEAIAAQFREADIAAMHQQGPKKVEETVTYPDGHKVIFETLKTPYFDSDGKVLGVIGISRNITDRKKKENEILYLNIHDVMTGLYNRLYFDKELSRIESTPELPYSIIFGDINALKLTNDLFGHSEGDKLIIETANLLKNCCIDGIVARIGGDEFAVLLPNTDEMAILEIVNRIHAVFHKHKSSADASKYFGSISLGYATKSDLETPQSEVLKTAEENMYRRKLLEHQSIRSSLLSTIKASLLGKSDETMGHTERMAELANRLGKELSLSEDEMVSLELMATLHDVGKIGINSNVLQKPGKLSEEEWVEMKRHPEIGYRIALTIPELQRIAEYILCHHERWDGKGYPQGIVGDNIPFISRIISVVDAYDAMTEDRTYRKAMPIQDAANEIIRNAGTQFDPIIARVFIEKILGLPFVVGS